jgi:hypothetical protein
MKLAEYSNDEIADLSFCRFLQHALPGKLLKAYGVLIARDVTTSPAPPNRAKRRLHCTNSNVIVDIERTPPSVDPAANQLAQPELNLGNVNHFETSKLSSLTPATLKKRKKYDREYCQKKKKKIKLYHYASPSLRLPRQPQPLQCNHQQ